MKSSFTIGAIFCITFLFGQVTILEENFEATLSEEWKIVNNDGFTPHEAVEEYVDAWMLAADPEDQENQTISSTSYFSPVNRADRWLITPQIQLGELNNYISWKGMSYDPSFPDSYKVMISTTGNDLSDFTDTLMVVSYEYYTWTEHLASLDEYAEQTIYIAFVNTTFDGFKLFLDAIYVREQDPLSLPQEEVTMNAYPNPMRDYLMVETAHANIEELTVVNSMGQAVYVEYAFVNDGKIKVNTTELTNGVYFVELRTSKGIIRKKIIK